MRFLTICYLLRCAGDQYFTTAAAAFASFGGDKGVKNTFFDVFRHTCAIVTVMNKTAALYPSDRGPETGIGV